MNGFNNSQEFKSIINFLFTITLFISNVNTKNDFVDTLLSWKKQ